MGAAHLRRHLPTGFAATDEEQAADMERAGWIKRAGATASGGLPVAALDGTPRLGRRFPKGD